MHAVGDHLDQEVGRLRDRDAPLIGAVADVHLDRRDGDHRNFEFLGHRHHGDGGGGGRRADQQVDLVLFDQLAGIARRRGRIGAVVELDHGDLLATDGRLILEPGLDPLGIGNADRGSVPAQRGHEADLDLGMGRRRQQGTGQQSADSRKSAHHIPLPSD